MLNELLARVSSLDDAGKAALDKELFEATKGRAWFPDPDNKPQTEAYYHPADEIYFGGEAGGGKTDLIIGLALTAHLNSLILRRTNKEATKLPERIADILGSREGYNGQDGVWRVPETSRVIDIGGCQLEDDKQKRKGIPHDLKCFDEITDFTETQYTFIIGWNRSSTPGQRCRIVVTGNPPTSAEGLWVIKRWAPWLDPTYPKPAQSGEIRWFTTGEDGKDLEVDGPGPHMIGGEEVYAKSRTFIRAGLSDNRYLGADYRARLAAMPEPYRSAYMHGRFDLSMKDQAFQVIPTDWVRQAQARWKPNPYPGIPMCAMGVDISRGGKDDTVLAPRYDGWYAPLIVVPGKEVPDGNVAAGLVVTHRRDACQVIIDMGGGYGGGPLEHLRANIGEKFVTGHVGSSSAVGRTEDRSLAFANRRSQIWWEFREALDPSRPGGSFIMLPDDPELVADLTAPTFKMTGGKIQVESKGEGPEGTPGLIKRLGRSPGRGDAVVMAWSEGNKALATHATWNAPAHRVSPQLRDSGGPKINTGYANRRRSR